MQIERLFKMVYMLLHEEKIAAAVFAERFGVSRRTIYRDVDTLSLAGIPIYTEKGKGGGISLISDFVLTKALLSDEEQKNILSALQGMENMSAANDSATLKKLSGIFNQEAVNWLEVDISDWSGEIDIFPLLKKGILERRVATFDYYSSAGMKGFRCVEPFQLWFKSRSWYLRAYCLDKGEERVYKLTRIKNLCLTEHPCLERELPLTAAVPDDTSSPEPLEVKLSIEPEKAYRLYDDFLESQIEAQKDGTFLVTAFLPRDNWAISLILSYGRHLEVLAPPCFRNDIQRELKALVDLYASETSFDQVPLNHAF